MSPRKRTPEPVGHWSQREILHLSVSRWLAVAGIAAMLGVPATLNRPVQLTNPPTPFQPQVPLQEWTTDGRLNVLAALAPGRLPPPDPRQRKPPCNEAIGEESIKGLCWLRLDVEPPCPRGQAWEENGKCYAYALRAASVPTSGGGRPGAVAEP